MIEWNLWPESDGRNRATRSEWVFVLLNNWGVIHERNYSSDTERWISVPQHLSGTSWKLCFRACSISNRLRSPSEIHFDSVRGEVIRPHRRNLILLTMFCLSRHLTMNTVAESWVIVQSRGRTNPKWRSEHPLTSLELKTLIECIMNTYLTNVLMRNGFYIYHFPFWGAKK
jgi:hypothetical protein